MIGIIVAMILFPVIMAIMSTAAAPGTHRA